MGEDVCGDLCDVDDVVDVVVDFVVYDVGGVYYRLLR